MKTDYHNKIVICKDHKNCIIDCPHSKPHIHDSISYSQCVNSPVSSCHCSEDKQYTRKLKLEKILKIQK